ncbi:hypothetical protein TNCV_3471661 [Trichonephila clavipes]|nr:hypothetical protein TNCV_3471661 [Trichonephila clavipes]
MGVVISNVLHAGTFVWLEKTQGSIKNKLPVPGFWQIKQLALSIYFLRGGGLLDDWSIEGDLSLTELLAEPDEIGNLIEEVLELDIHRNSEVDSDEVQELLVSHNQELTIDELIEIHE